MKLKPLFKWTGGKNKMKQKYSGIFLPEKRFDVFVDCFYGAGAVSHWILRENPHSKFIINDFNSELISLYESLRDDTKGFITLTKKLQEKYLAINTYEDRKEFYTDLKMSHIHDYETMGKLKTAVNLHFMMKVNFNGWWKIYNYSNGRYATPPGTLDEKNSFIDIRNLQNTGEFFKERCIILNGDFEVVSPHISDKTFVYFDPPYRDSTTEYTDDGFNEEDQIRLCEFFRKCDSAGSLVSLSNKEIGDHFFETHLGEFNLHKMDVKYSAGRGDTINEVMEILVTNYSPYKENLLENFFT